jgi:hypothetical protein
MLTTWPRQPPLGHGHAMPNQRPLVLSSHVLVNPLTRATPAAVARIMAGHRPLRRQTKTVRGDADGPVVANALADPLLVPDSTSIISPRRARRCFFDPFHHFD